MQAAPKSDYSGAEIVFAAVAVLAAFIVHSPRGGLTSGVEWTEALIGGAIGIGLPGLSAAVACRMLRPLARRLVGHQYFLRPVIMGCAAVILAFALFGLIGISLQEIWIAVTREHYSFDATKTLSLGLAVSIIGFFMTCGVTLPLGMLAGYCVEILGWFREDALSRRRGEMAGPRICNQGRAVSRGSPSPSFA